MRIISDTIRLLVLMSIVLALMVGCDGSYILPGGYRIEWDEYDPKLHGQVVHFKEPMRYVLLEEKHIGDYLKEEVEVGRTLQTEEAALGPGGAATRGYSTVRVDDGIPFTIKSSYWHRKDWFGRHLTGDIRKLLLVDKNGVESITIFGFLAIASDRPELAKLENTGEHR